LRFDANLDRIDALAEERTLEWRRIGEAEFLTLDEQRAAAGYGPAPQGFAAKGSGRKESAALELRYSADQPRAPAGTSTGGRWIPAGGASGGDGGWNGGGDTTQRVDVAMNIDPNVTNDAGGLIHLVQNRPGRTGRIFPGPGGPTYEQLDRQDAAREEAIVLMTRVRMRDPSWRPGAVLTDPENIESDIARYRSWGTDARARLEELSPRGIGDNNPPDMFSIFPNLSGRRAKISERDDPETRRGLYRENESADVSYASGHSVEQKPIIKGRKNPDYLIDGEVFDNYAPKTGSRRNIRGLLSKRFRKIRPKASY
jgi:hypothetical protein